MIILADFETTDNCINIYSYGEICVHCGCCENEPNNRRRYINRLHYYKERLKDELHFCSWDDDPYWRKVQEKNVKSDIDYLKKEIRKTKKILKIVR